MNSDELAGRLGLDEGAPLVSPVDDLFQAIATATELPVLEIAACLSRIEEAAPPLIRLIERAATGAALAEADKQLLFTGLHLLGGARHTAGFPALMQLVRLPLDPLEDLLGDAITMTLPKIVIGMFDGNAALLFDTIAQDEVDEFARGSMFGAAAFLTWEGRIDERMTREFLVHFHQEELAEEGSHAWFAWEKTISLLGLRNLAPLACQAWAEGWQDPAISSLDYFERDLAEAERDPADPARFEADHLGYIADVADALSWVAWGEQDEPLDDWEDYDLLPPMPATNPWRNIGRNEPCPCGSGKKAKKCCMTDDAKPSTLAIGAGGLPDGR